MMPRRQGIGTIPIFVAVVTLLAVGTIGLAMLGSPSNQRTLTPTSSSSSTTSSLTPPSSSSTTSGVGLRLDESVNASTITVGQSLDVSMSITNTVPSANAILPSDHWDFQGVPVALWPPCYFGLPAQAVVLKGNYTLHDLQSVANATFSYACAEGVIIDHVIFQPSSDWANITGLYNAGTSSNETLGPFHTALNFTAAGYWDLLALSQRVNAPILGEGQSPPPAYTAFSPGVYTVAVADEWGQAAVLHVTVLPASTTTTSSSSSSGASPSTTTTFTQQSETSSWCVITGQPGPLFLRIASDSDQAPVPGAQVTATNQPAYCGNALGSSPATGQTSLAFTTNDTEWYSLPSGNDAGYSFVVRYSGQSYSFTADLRPLSVTCATLLVPSGKTSVTITEFQTTCPSGTASGASTPNSNGLQLRLSIDANQVYAGGTIQATISEFNTLDRMNNVTESGDWKVQAALSSCPNTNAQPFGIALYKGHYTAENVSQGTQVQVFPATVCPMFMRYVSGYLFQPDSDLATILPGSGPTQMVATIDLVNGTGTTSSQPGSGQSTPLAPGSYTVAAADEWGETVFLYFQVNDPFPA